MVRQSPPGAHKHSLGSIPYMRGVAFFLRFGSVADSVIGPIFATFRWFMLSAALDHTVATRKTGTNETSHRCDVNLFQLAAIASTTALPHS